MDGASSGRFRATVAGGTDHPGLSRPVGLSFARSDFLVGDWLAQPGLVRLSRGSVSVRVRPQLMDLLVCLADHAARTVSRKELFGSVWAGQFVTESALARCIAELRQLLGDDAHHPRFIETIPKRGYRLVAMVTDPEPTPGPEQAAGSMSAGRVLAATPAPPAVQSSLLRADGARHSAGLRQWLLRAGAAIACVAGVGLLVRQGLTAPVRISPSRVIVSIDNTTGDPAFDETLRLALAIQLERSPRLRVLSGEVIGDALVRTGAAPEPHVTRAVAGRVCREAGASQIVAGSIGVMGRTYVLGLEAVACETGETLVRRQVEVAEKEEVLRGVERLAPVLRDHLLAASSLAPLPGAAHRSMP